jgi:hypothetical protein
VTRIVTNTAREAELVQHALQILGDDAPRKDLELRLAQGRAKRKKTEARQVAELGAFAGRVLVEGGLLVTYAGHYWLHKVLASFEPYLQYRWCLASVWEGPGNVAHLGGWKQRNGRVLSKWKPILLFIKGKPTKAGGWFDVSIVRAKEKEWHEWQQPLEQVERLVKDFSEPGKSWGTPCLDDTTIED